MGWMVGGVSRQRLNRLLQDRGIDFSINDDAAKVLLTAGAGPGLIQSLRATHPSIAATGASCPGLLAQAGEMINERRYQEADRLLPKIVTDKPRNPVLHLALCHVRQQERAAAEAFD